MDIPVPARSFLGSCYLRVVHQSGQLVAPDFETRSARVDGLWTHLRLDKYPDPARFHLLWSVHPHWTHHEALSK